MAYFRDGLLGLQAVIKILPEQDTKVWLKQPRQTARAKAKSLG